jgi:TPR repeat protein
MQPVLRKKLGRMYYYSRAIIQDKALAFKRLDEAARQKKEKATYFIKRAKK